MTKHKLKLRPEAKAAWLAALRSGKYQQTTRDLCNSRGYCCLGVGAKVINGLSDNEIRHRSLPDREWMHAWWESVDEVENNLSYTYRNPRLPEGSGRIPFGASLTECNDERKLSFAEIADLIEEHF